MKVWNVQRYDKLNLVKSFLLTLAAEDLIWRAASDALRRAKNKLLYLRRISFPRHHPIFCPFRTFRDNQIADRLIRVFNRERENLRSPYLPN